jgi:hypothetical protein
MHVRVCSIDLKIDKAKIINPNIYETFILQPRR